MNVFGIMIWMFLAAGCFAQFNAGSGHGYILGRSIAQGREAGR